MENISRIVSGICIVYVVFVLGLMTQNPANISENQTIMIKQSEASYQVFLDAIDSSAFEVDETSREVTKLFCSEVSLSEFDKKIGEKVHSMCLALDKLDTAEEAAGVRERRLIKEIKLKIPH